MKQYKIILASSSPRRKELISWTRIPFSIAPADIDERVMPDETPLELVQRLALEKAQKIAGTETDAIVLAADTIVVHQGTIIGKPRNATHAEQILRSLRDKTHQVITAIALIAPNKSAHRDVCVSQVKMRDYSDVEINAYIASGDPMDKAGAYAIQNGDFKPVPDFSGCFASVMGFPFCHIERNLRRIDGYNCLPVAEICQKNLHYPCPIHQRVLDGEDIG